jgi:hypothetical protein
VTTTTIGIWLFAVYQIFCRVFFSGTRQRSSLPSATQKTLDKIKHSAKKLFAECFIFDTRKKVSLPSVLFLTLDKELFAECFFLTLGKEFLAECQKYNTRQRALCRVRFSTLGKDNLKFTF